MILAIDPSSTRTGYAVVSTAGDVVESGGIRKPSKASPTDGVSHMIDTLTTKARAHGVYEAVIEEPTVQRRQARGDGKRRAPHTSIPYVVTYGRIYEAMRAIGLRVIPVTAGAWSRNTPKAARAQRIKIMVPSYTGKGDAGMDEADAIGIGLWWCQQRRIREAG